MTAAAWDRLEEFWGNHAKRKAYASSRAIELAKSEKRQATESEAIMLQAKRLRGNVKVYDALNMSLGVTLADDAFANFPDHEQRARLKEKIDEQEH